MAVHRKNLIRADYRGAYHADRPYDMFGELMTQYYWIDPNGRVNVLKPTKRNVAKVFGEKKNLMNAFVEEHAIDFRRTDDLVQLVQYYDQH